MSKVRFIESKKPPVKVLGGGLQERSCQRSLLVLAVLYTKWFFLISPFLKIKYRLNQSDNEQRQPGAGTSQSEGRDNSLLGKKMYAN